MQSTCLLGQVPFSLLVHAFAVKKARTTHAETSTLEDIGVLTHTWCLHFKQPLYPFVHARTTGLTASSKHSPAVLLLTAAESASTWSSAYMQQRFSNTALTCFQEA